MPRGVLAIAVLSIVAGSGVAQSAQPSPADAKTEAGIRADVAKVGEEAAKAFDDANAARERGDIGAAEAGYRKAIELAPDVDHPHRRLCMVLVVKGELALAVSECEKALALAPQSPWNESAMASRCRATANVA